MGLPLKEAQGIAASINKEFGGWGWSAQVLGPGNEVVVKTEGGVRFAFESDLRDFTNMTRGWSVTFRILEGEVAIVIW